MKNSPMMPPSGRRGWRGWRSPTRPRGRQSERARASRGWCAAGIRPIYTVINDNSGVICREPTIPLPTLIHDALELLIAALQVDVAAKRTLHGPEDLTTETTAQMVFYTPTSGRPGSSNRPGGTELLPTLLLYSRYPIAGPRIGPSASLCRRAICSGLPSGS